jgi:sugar lactone lactonase YvrE
VATIGGGSTGISTPEGVALDASGRVYVANYGASNVLVFGSNPVGSVTSAPVATIGGGSTGISYPVGVALDASGRVYVSNYNVSVTTYAANPIGSVTTAPLFTVTDSAFYNQRGIAVH